MPTGGVKGQFGIQTLNFTKIWWKNEYRFRWLELESTNSDYQNIIKYGNGFERRISFYARNEKDTDSYDSETVYGRSVRVCVASERVYERQHFHVDVYSIIQK